MIERGERRVFKGVERVGSRAPERIVRDEAVAIGGLIVSDNVPELERKLCRNRDAAGMLEIVRRDVGMTVCS